MSVRGRIVFDLLLTVLLLFECLHQLTGNALHEIVGAAFFICIVIHLTFASRWIKSAAGSLKNGDMAKRQKKLAVVALLLAVDVVVLMCSSVIISQLLWDAGFDFTALNPGNIWYPIHTVAAYALCILVLGCLLAVSRWELPGLRVLGFKHRILQSRTKMMIWKPSNTATAR